jgi:hypothetical protein
MKPNYILTIPHGFGVILQLTEVPKREIACFLQIDRWDLSIGCNLTIIPTSPEEEV